jgi:hypothetical protein
MTIRIIPLMLLWMLAGAACGKDGGGVAQTGNEVRFDTAAGFRLGMLLPEARAAAAAHSDTFECRVVATDAPPARCSGFSPPAGEAGAVVPWNGPAGL